MDCKHKEITMFNTTGKALEKGAYEVDFAIRYRVCGKELFRISEYERTIVNVSKH